MDDVAVSVVLFPDVVVDNAALLFRFLSCCASAWKGPVKQVQLLVKFIVCHWLYPFGDHVCLVRDISVYKENPSYPEKE